MAQGSGVAVTVDTAAVSFLPGVRELAADGILPEGMYRNRRYAEAAVDPGDAPLAVQDLLYDPQTAGGLLIAVDGGDADALQADLQGAVPCAQRVGVVSAWDGGPRIMLR